MQELWPTPTDDLDIAARLRDDTRTAPPTRPWITLVMIASIDGGVILDGLSGGLGGPADQTRFLAARHQADVIIVGSTTAREEDYRPTKAPIAVITGTLSLDPDARLFGDPSRRPLLMTTTQAVADRGHLFDGIAEVADLGNSIEATAVATDLHRRGHRAAVLEGGPTLNGQFLAADLVDEILLTVSPLVVCGDSPRLGHGPAVVDGHRFTLARVVTSDDFVFLRYLRRPHTG